jgi:hypothetical protein
MIIGLYSHVLQAFFGTDLDKMGAAIGQSVPLCRLNRNYAHQYGQPQTTPTDLFVAQLFKVLI